MSTYRNKEDGAERKLPPFWGVHAGAGVALVLAFALIASGDGRLPHAGGLLLLLTFFGYGLGADPNDPRTFQVFLYGSIVLSVAGGFTIVFAEDRHVWLAGVALVGVVMLWANWVARR